MPTAAAKFKDCPTLKRLVDSPLSFFHFALRSFCRLVGQFLDIAVGRIQLLDFSGMVTIKFYSESPSFKENLNQVLFVSLLMISLTALSKEGLFFS